MKEITNSQFDAQVDDLKAIKIIMDSKDEFKILLGSFAQLIHRMNQNRGFYDRDPRVMRAIESLITVGMGPTAERLADATDRNPIELLGLAMTEISEGIHGIRKGMMDDHLPEYPMEQVEVADAIIRLLDYASFRGFAYELPEIIVKKLEYNTKRPYRHGDKTNECTNDATGGEGEAGPEAPGSDQG